MEQDNNGEQEFQAKEPGLEATPLPVSAKVRFVRRLSKHMASYNCKHCQDYVRGGVILICGHMFCWTCFWPFVADEPLPECPQCKTRLFLHEDITPFYGEGPNARPEDNDFLAEPGAVPRPSGICFTEPEEEESVDEDENENDDDAAGQIPIEGDPLADPEIDEPLQLRFNWKLYFTQIVYAVKSLKWIQMICASIMILVWCFASMT